MAHPNPGLGSLAILQQDNIHLGILERSFTPLTKVNASEFGGNIRAVVTPMISIHAFQVSKEMSRICGGVLANVVSSNGALLRWRIYRDTTLLCDENITLESLNTINWPRFSEVKFITPRIRSLACPKSFPTEPTGRYGFFIMTKAITPPSYYPTMPAIELFYDQSYLTINVMTAAQYNQHITDLDPRHRNPVLCKQEGCHCNATTIRPDLIRTGITGNVENFLSPTPRIEALHKYQVLTLPAWESGCQRRFGHVWLNGQLIPYAI